MSTRSFIVNFDLVGLADGSWLQLPDSLYRHAVLALRHGPGDKIVLRDPDGRQRTCTLEFRGNVMGVIIGTLEESPTLDEPAVVLAPALFKSQRFEWMLEKSAELGATAIAPVEAERSVVRWRPQKADKKLGRWNKILQEAARQSEALVPGLSSPVSLESRIEELSDEHTLLYAEPDSETLVAPASGPTAVFTGPEGGFSPAELAALQDAGATAIDLGPRILRAETAPLVALTLLRRRHDT